MTTKLPRLLFAGLLAVALVGWMAAAGQAQCSTCPTATMAYQPVSYTAYQPVVSTPASTGWYPGKLIDQWRMRRWGMLDTAAPSYTAAPAYTAAPTYSASYAPSYTSCYAPSCNTCSPCNTGSCTTYYKPYVTSYAPLVRRALYRPTTVTLRPVGTVCTSCGVDPCGCTSGCSTGGCSTCGVSQASYVESSGCSSCAAASSGPIYSNTPSVGTSTPQPQLAPNEPAPAESTYRANKPVTPPEENGVKTDNGSDLNDPMPLPENGASESSTLLQPPQLYHPGDRTASRPTVDIHTAVYHKPITPAPVSTPAPRQPTQAEQDAAGWGPVSK